MGFIRFDTSSTASESSTIANQVLAQDCANLTHRLLECLSLALDLSPSDSLCQHHAQSLFDMSLIHYPAIPRSLVPSAGLSRIPAHSDFGTLTLLFQDDVGGLEIADTSSTKSDTSVDVEKTGRFIHVDPKPGAIIINIGYLLMRWSNGRWKNTVHRVSLPPRPNKDSKDVENVSEEGDESIPERYSIGCFSSPDPNTTVAPYSSCCQSEPAKWKPINAGEFLQKKRAAIYK